MIYPMVAVDVSEWPATLGGRMNEILDRLARTAMACGRREPRRGHGGSFQACCPAHDDRDPSLSLTLEPNKILIHCFAGCSVEDVTGAIGVPMEVLFSDYRGNGAAPVPAWRPRGTPGGTAEIVPFRGPSVSQLDAGPMALPPPLVEFLELEFPPIEPLLGPIATQQIVLLYAPPGVGKTMFGLALAHAIAAGQSFLGWDAHRRARVLVVDGEMAGEMMQSRLARAAVEDGYLRIANLTNWGAVAGYEPVNLCTAAGQDVIDVWAEATGSEVIVLDNLMSLAWLDGQSMNSDEFWQPVRRFAAAQRGAGRTVIVVDHANAQGEIFGTKTKLWHADLAIKLAPLDGIGDESELFSVTKTTRFSLSFSKVRGTPDGVSHETAEKAVTVGAVGQDWKWTVGKAEQRMAACEMHRNGLSIRDIADELGVAKSTVGRWVRA